MTSNQGQLEAHQLPGLESLEGKVIPVSSELVERLQPRIADRRLQRGERCPQPLDRGLTCVGQEKGRNLPFRVCRGFRILK